MHVLAMVACGGDDGGGPGPGPDADVVDSGSVDGGASDADLPPTDGGADAGPPPMLCEAREVRCQEASVAELRLFEAPAPAGLITEEGTTPGEFLTHVDATARPMSGTVPTTSYVYARFTPTGLEQVGIGDEDAFDSLDWDIAFRRFVIRLNSGVSGPSCVRGVRVPPIGGAPATFEAVTRVPDALSLFEESYFSETSPGSCVLVNDGSGLPGSPDTVLASYWRYGGVGCLQMTGNVYVVALRNGRHVKLQVTGYYSPANQERCQMDLAPEMPSGAANLRIRWAFVDGPAGG
jgi:hypothetical protein